VSTGNFEPIVAQWRERREAEGNHVGLHDLYEMVAAPRGLSITALSIEERNELTELSQAVFWPGYERVAPARPFDPVDILPFASEWAVRFDDYAQRLRVHLGDQRYRLHHIGSTSVSGLAAKPIVDILLCVEDLADETSYVPAATEAGFELLTRDDVHRFFQVPWPAPRDAQLHVCQLDSAFEVEHVLFRDYLRKHAAVRDAYAALKQRAAGEWRDDRVGYTYAKNTFIIDTIAHAEAERGANT